MYCSTYIFFRWFGVGIERGQYFWYFIKILTIGRARSAVIWEELVDNLLIVLISEGRQNPPVFFV